MVTILGGTFAFLHPGHKKLLEAAVATGEKIIVGLTSDEYLEANKRYKAVPFEKRKARIAEFLGDRGAEFSIVPLDSKEGSSTTGKDFTTIVVSRETYPRAVKINSVREGNGLAPMRIVVVPHVLADDLFPIASTRIIGGEIDEDGHRLTPVRVSVCTGNNLKVKGVEDVFRDIMGSIEATRNGNYTPSVKQPVGDDTMGLANERALSGLEDNDYSVGIEAGIFRNPINDTYYDVHCAVIIDRYGDVTTGFSSAFQVPASIVSLVKRGHDLSSAVEKLQGIRNVGEEEGLAGLMSGGRVKRIDLIHEAVRNALIPRMNVHNL